MCSATSLRGDSEAVVLWEDDDLVVFLDRSPIREGHAHVMPRTHFDTFELMPPELAGRIITAGQELAKRQKEVYGIERVAFLFTGGDVPHVHAHVIPMHAKTDVTSARYLVTPEEPRWSAEHLRTSLEERRRVRGRLGYGSFTS